MKDGRAYRTLAGLHYRGLRLIVFASTLVTRMRCQPFLEVGPQTRIDRGLRVRPYAARGDGFRIILSGNNSVGRNCTFQGRGKIEFGSHARCRSHCLLDATESIRIGAYSAIADAVTIRDSDHRFDRLDVPVRQQGLLVDPVIIGEDVWIGHGATILRGVQIGDGAVVAAGAVVRSAVPAQAIVGGVPARVLGWRGSEARVSGVARSRPTDQQPAADVDGVL